MRTTYYYLKTSILLILFTSTFNALAQSGKITGKVKTSDNKAASRVNIQVTETGKACITLEDGSFSIDNLKAGEYTLKSSHVGLATQEKKVRVEDNQTTSVEFTLEENAEKLSEVVITSYKSANSKPVSAGKIEIHPLDLPQNIAVIGAKIIQDQQASRLGDVLKNVNGIALGASRGSTSDNFYARGYSLGANNYLKNGARSNNAVMPEASTLEAVEVLKGSASLLYGTVSGGAVINMVTKKPKFHYGGEVSMRAGSYDFYKPIVDVYGPISKNLAFRVVGTYENAGSFRNSVKSTRYYVNPSLLYKLGEKTTILLQGDYLNHDFTPDFGVGSVDGKIPENMPRSRFLNTPWAYNKVDQTNTSLNVTHNLNDNWKVSFIAANQFFKRNYFSTERPQANAEGDWNRALTRSRVSENYYNGQLFLTGKFNTWKISHQLLAGTDGEEYRNTTYTFHKFSTAYDKINILDPGMYDWRTDMPETQDSLFAVVPTSRIGFYAQDLISLSQKVKVLAGLRWSYQKISRSTIYSAGTEAKVAEGATATRHDRAFSPRVGLVYQPISTSSVFVSYSNNFVTNTGIDVKTGNALKPSIIDQFEVGVKNDFLKGKLSVNLTYYKIINNDFAQMAALDREGNANTDTNLKEFSGQTTSDGAEIDITGTIINGLDFIAGYSYNFMRYTKTSGLKGSFIEGERLVGNTAHTANSSLFYTLNRTKLKGLKVGASIFYTGTRNGGWNNTVGQTQQFSRLIPVKPFTTVDLSVGYSFSNFSVLAKLSNITNELNYYVHENYSINPIPPRQVVATVSYKF